MVHGGAFQSPSPSVVFIHSPDDSLSSAQQASSLLFSTSPASVSTAAVLSALGSDPRVKRVPLELLRDQSLTKIAARWGLVESNSASFFSFLWIMN